MTIDVTASPGDKIAACFSEHAPSYDRYAYVQKKAAGLFDLWLCGLNLARPASMAEIGCGTGLFTRLLRQRYKEAQLTVTDLAPDMLAYCRSVLGSSAATRYAICDGRTAEFSPAPDWIVSTMCFQWFDPLIPVLQHHLQRSRMLAFSVVLDGSFRSWRMAHRKAGLQPGLRTLPDYGALVRACHKLGASRVETHRITLTQHHADGLHFATTLRAIGANCPQPGHRPGNLRPVLRQLNHSLEMNYEIGFFCLER